MAYGLRLINNCKPASLDGREWSTYGDPGFYHGKVSHGPTGKGSTAKEVLFGRAVRRAAAAGGSPGGQPEKARGFASEPWRGASPQSVVMRRWQRAHSAPTSTDAMCPRAKGRETMQEMRSAAARGAAASPEQAALLLPGRSAAAAATKPARTTAGELYDPATCSQHKHPVQKHHWHPEALVREASEPSQEHRLHSLPSRLVTQFAEEWPTEKYRYFSDPGVSLSIHSRSGNALSVGRQTWRAPRGATLRMLPQALTT